MRKINLYLYSAIAFVLLSSFEKPGNITFTQVDPLIKIFQETAQFPLPNKIIEAAAGQHAVFQFAIRSSVKLKDVNVILKGLSNSQGNQITDIQSQIIGYVSVKYTAATCSHDVIIPPSKLYPDPLYNKSDFAIQAGITQPIWITINIPSNTKPGIYKGDVKLTGYKDGKRFRLIRNIKLRVYPIIMESPSLYITNWYYTEAGMLKLFNSGKDVTPFSKIYWDYIKEIAQKMKSCYQNTVFISPFNFVDFKLNGDKYSFDFTNYDKFISILKDYKILKLLEGGHLAFTGSWGSSFRLWCPKFNNGKTEDSYYPIDSPIAQNFYQQFIPALMQHLKELKLDSIYYQHIGDEPTEHNVDSYIEIAHFIKRLAPKIKFIEACLVPKLENIINIWVPRIDVYKEGYDFFNNRQKHGDKVWFYTCSWPQGEYANRFIELPLLKTRLIHWLNFKYGATGYLHWGFNYWQNDPNKEASLKTENGIVWPGGDSWIVYPGKNKINSSIRLEAMRDGVEDYTLLKMLEKKNSKIAQELCNSIIYSWDSYNMDSTKFWQIRHRILIELSKNDLK
jgi:hypothetical protein